MRRKHTKPTYIYWLIDLRPEMIAAGWHAGYAFYCGKTVKSIAKRLAQHRHAAINNPVGKVSSRILECGSNLKIQLLETVPFDQDWVAREKHWIRITRFSFPDNANVSEGGSGATGWVPGPEMRAKVGASSQARWNDPEYRARQSAAHMGHKRSPDSIARGAEKLRRNYLNPEYRERNRQFIVGRTASEETKIKMGIAQRAAWIKRKAKKTEHHV